MGRGSCRGDADGVSAAQGTSPLRMKSTNMLERYNEELRRRTRVVRIFPNAESCLRLILALAAETHERWLTGQRYLL